ncbi:hypothetical protein [Anaeroselena agilis]|uniref:Uncharacterized protein n=1 Tax=Anaeroselena agilis TaxID=3063788 RepID=A0ABU3NV15_9FIRM|nr:hypothetical protein [Selenomonadales bacterium 4137-cl]
MRTTPSVRRGTPEANEASEYEQQTVNGATVYVHNSLRDLDNVEIDAEVSVFGSKLVLKGVQTAGRSCC